MNYRYCYAVRFDGDWSPSAAVWATESMSAKAIAAQLGIGKPTGAVEMFTPVAWKLTFGPKEDWNMPVVFGPGFGHFHRYKGRLYTMNEYGTFVPATIYKMTAVAEVCRFAPQE